MRSISVVVTYGVVVAYAAKYFLDEGKITIKSALLFGIPSLIVVALVYGVIKYYRNYKYTTYKFYTDRLEYEDGFFNTNKKVINLKDVREVSIHRSILQRFFNLGTVFLNTAATGVSGILLFDIADSEAMYDKIKSLVDAQRKAGL